MCEEMQTTTWDSKRFLPSTCVRRVKTREKREDEGGKGGNGEKGRMGGSLGDGACSTENVHRREATVAKESSPRRGWCSRRVGLDASGRGAARAREDGQTETRAG